MADIKSQPLRNDSAAISLAKCAQGADHRGDKHPEGAKQDRVHIARSDAFINHELEQARHAQLHRDRQHCRPESEEELPGIGSHELEDAPQGFHGTSLALPG